MKRVLKGLVVASVVGLSFLWFSCDAEEMAAKAGGFTYLSTENSSSACQIKATIQGYSEYYYAGNGKCYGR